MSLNQTHNFEFLLFEGFSNLVLASAMEPLRDVKLRSNQTLIDWSISTLDGNPVFSSSGLRVAPDHKFDESRNNRTLILIAGYKVREQVTRALMGKLRRAVRNAEPILALDTASWLLAAAGVLDGHKAAIHWQEFDAFKETYPQVHTSTKRYVRSGPFLTCGGASSVLDMTLDLIKQLFGPATAFEASTMFLYHPAHQYKLSHGVEQLHHSGSPKVLMALDVMVENIETPLSTYELAAKVSLSERTLNRMFTAELGITPGKYYQLFRLQQARYLAEETPLSAEQIALRCGYSSASSLGRSFLKIFGLSIRALRGANKT